MFKIFAYVYKGDKITRTFDFCLKGRFKSEKLFDYLTEICHGLDISVPIVLKSHVVNLQKYNHTKFVSSDFVETVSFSRLVLQKYEED